MKKEYEHHGSLQQKAQTRTQLFSWVMRLLGYVTIAWVVISAMIYASQHDLAGTAQLALLGVFVTPIVGVTLFLLGLVSRWNQGTSKHDEIVGITSTFIWVLPTISFFVMK